MKKEFYVHGMHCPACEVLIEDKLMNVQGVKEVEAKVSTSKVTIDVEHDVSAKELSDLVEEYGYKISENIEEKTKINTLTLFKGFLIAVFIFGTFLFLQKLGIVNLLNPEDVTLPFVFLIGVVASLSTCMAVVGGLVLSISSNLARNKKYLPLISFHLARIVGFFIFGGIIGLIGSAVILNAKSIFFLNTILFVVMIIMGLNLMDIFKFIKKIQIKFPKFMGRHILKFKDRAGILPAALMGAATFILPCGFTQSMQIYSLTTGNFMQGALTMLVFALGTFPVLSLISFASVKLTSKLFFTTAGFLVIMFAIFNFVNGLNALVLF